MRAIEFINEDKEKKLRMATRLSLPGAVRLDGSDQYYDFYRLGLAIAGAPDNGTPKEGPAKDSPSIWPYTDVDEEKVKKALKNQGIKSKIIISKGKSEELPSTNTVSPVAQWMK